MARISGVNIPSNKRVVIALTYIYGIGSKIAKDICNKVDLEESKRVNQLSDDEIARIREIIDADHMVEGNLRRNVSLNIKRLTDLGCYRARIISIF